MSVNSVRGVKGVTLIFYVELYTVVSNTDANDNHVEY